MDYTWHSLSDKFYKNTVELLRNNELVADFLITTDLTIGDGLLSLELTGELGMAHEHTCQPKDKTGDFMKALLTHGFSANSISSDLAIPCSAKFQIFAQLKFSVVLKLNKIRSGLPDLRVGMTQKALIDYNQNENRYV